MALCASSAFGGNNNYIKVGNDSFLAIDGSSILNKLMLSDLRIPYKQVQSSRIILKPGQVNYFLNHMAFGDNLTFLAIKATYDSKSIYEEDNYVNWSYYDDMTKTNVFSHLMVLTGNTTNRIKQMYLTNPNPDYSVTLDLMVAILDDNYSFFNNTLDQQGTTFVNLDASDIKTHIVGESIVIYDKSDTPRPLIYLTLDTIESINRTGSILSLDDTTLGAVFLHFNTESEAAQAHSLLSYVLSNPSVNINALSPLYDNSSPVIYFYSQVGTNADYILFNGSSASVPYDTTDGVTFSTNITLDDYAELNPYVLSQILIDDIVDNRDGTMSATGSTITIKDNSGQEYDVISATGSYVLEFNVSDLALNNLNDIIFNLNII